MKKPLCGAVKRSGRHCKRPAGWGTEHYGLGYCQDHDSLPAEVSRMLPAPSRIKALAEHFKTDRDPFDLREEIALTRATLAELFSDVEQDVDLLKAAPVINMLLNTVGKLVQRLHEIEVGRKYVIQVDQVHLVLKQVLAIVVEHVPDPLARAAIADQIGAIEVEQTGQSAPELGLSKREADLHRVVTDQRPATLED